MPTLRSRGVWLGVASIALAAAVERSGLRISSQLLGLANVVRTRHVR